MISSEQRSILDLIHISKMRLFDRIYDSDPGLPLPLSPGNPPPVVDPSSEIPRSLPALTPTCGRERYERTPIYGNLTSVSPVSFCVSQFQPV